MQHITKRVLIAGMLTLILPGCRKEIHAPMILSPEKEGAHPATTMRRPASVSSSPTTYCFTTQQSSVEDARIVVYQDIGSASTIASYSIRYDYANASTGFLTTSSGWIPVSGFAYTLPHGTGQGSTVSNIRVKETRCYTTPWGTNCRDQFYDVPYCR